MKHKRGLCRDLMIRDKVQDITDNFEQEVLCMLQSMLDNDGLELEKEFNLPRAVQQFHTNQPRSFKKNFIMTVLPFNRKL